MTDEWLKIGRGSIFADKSKNGLLFSFLKEYKIQFKVSVTPSCRKCLDLYWLNYEQLKTTKMEVKKAECNYVLKAKYNGIQLGVNGDPIRNGEMTNEIAKELLEKHPRGEQLFSFIPEDEVIETEEVEKLNSEKSLKELRLDYPEIKATSRVSFLQKIEESEEAIENDLI